MTPELQRLAQAAVQVITRDGHRLSAGRAVLFVLEEIGWHPALVHLLQRRPLLWLVESSYRLVARHRGLFARLLSWLEVGD